MKIKKLIKKQRNEYIKIPKPDVPKGLFRKCKKCGAMVLSEEVKEKNYVCPKCGGYFRIHANGELESLQTKEVLSLGLREWKSAIHCTMRNM